MSDTDDFVTGAFQLGATALDTWFSIFKGLSITAAEVLNPDDVIFADNYVAEYIYPKDFGALCLSWFTPTEVADDQAYTTFDPAKTPDVIGPHQLSMSPSGVTEQRYAPDGTTMLPQEVKVWVTDPTSLPDGIKDTYFGAFYLVKNLSAPFWKFSLSVSKHAAPYK